MSLLEQSGRISMNSFSPGVAAAPREGRSFSSIVEEIEFNQSPALRLRRVLLVAALVTLVLRTGFAQVPPHIPPPAISIPETDRPEETGNAAPLQKKIAEIPKHSRTNAHDLPPL